MTILDRLFVQHSRQSMLSALVLFILTLFQVDTLVAQLNANSEQVQPTLTIGNEIIKKADITGTDFIPNSPFSLWLCVESPGSTDCSGISGHTDSHGNFVLTFSSWLAFCDICDPPPRFFADEATLVQVRFGSTEFSGFKLTNIPDSDSIFVSLSPTGSLEIGPREFNIFSIFGDGFPPNCRFAVSTDTFPVGLGAGFSGDGSWGFAFGKGEAINAASEFIWKGSDEDCTNIFTGSTTPGGPYPKTVVLTERLGVAIDIKPGSEPNSINCNNDNGVITVAILTTGDFDTTTVDHTTVTFEGASETHVDRQSGEPRRHEEDVDGDGDIDLVFHFRLGDTDLTCESTEGTLTGETFDDQSVEGTDSVNMIGS